MRHSISNLEGDQTSDRSGQDIGKPVGAETESSDEELESVIPVDNMSARSNEGPAAACTRPATWSSRRYLAIRG